MGTSLTRDEARRIAVNIGGDAPSLIAGQQFGP